jgi:phosphoenolpyruvate carboxykinase (ATP)
MSVLKTYHNASVAKLIEIAVREEGCRLTNSGALVAYSDKTGRSPKDKRIVDEPETSDIWWGSVNIKLDRATFDYYSQCADTYLHSDHRNGNLFIVDAFCGWDPEHRLKIRLFCISAYHALFMRNMLIPSEKPFDEPPDFVIKNVGQLRLPVGPDSSLTETLIGLCFSKKEMLIFGTRYAGEMKKGILTLMMYRMPLVKQLCLHSSANVDLVKNELTVFFGLSGTGKTTLSADPKRRLIGDDEHVWTQSGVFNIEGGCYAKCIDLDREKEPEIFNALRYGAILENVVLDEQQEPIYSDASITENTRGAYPLQYIPSALIPAIVERHPNHIVFLTCDTFGLLPPVSRLNIEQAVDFFVAGYTSKAVGTEVGVKAPQAVFSACFGEPFLVWQPQRYGQLLRERLLEHGSKVWLLNTGWVEGGFGVGHRIPIRTSRLLLDAIHSGELDKQEFTTLPCFGFEVPATCPELAEVKILNPLLSWPAGEADYLMKLADLKQQFDSNLAIKLGLRVETGGGIAAG